MRSQQKIILIVVAVVVAVGGFVVLSPGGDDAAVTPTTPVATTPVATSDTPASTTTAAQPAFTTISVKGAKPVGGVATIKATKGDTVRIAVASPDTTSEIHLHGYDIKRDLTAGGTVRFVFKASAEGIFEMELEDAAVPIAKVEIGPS